MTDPATQRDSKFWDEWFDALAAHNDREGAPVPLLGDVGKCPSCGQQSRSYSRGCSNCGHGAPVTTPAHEEIPR